MIGEEGSPAGLEGERERGWRGPILAIAAMLVGPILVPDLRILFPIDEMILLLAPALAVCAVAGWQRGGRWSLAFLWLGLAAWVLWLPAREDAFSFLARAWGVIMAIAFFATAAVRRVGTRLLPRALLAIPLAMVVWTAVVAATPTGLPGARALHGTEIERRATFAQEALRQRTGSVTWVEFERRNPAFRDVTRAYEEQLAALPAVARRVFPALLALESLAMLALAWALYHRVGRARLGPPLAKWRDLRFHDAFVWGVIAGLLTLVLPAAELVRTVGINLLVFFGVLYALRGAGVVMWFLAPSRWVGLLLALFAIFAWPVAWGVAVGVGLGDTWFDWRRRERPTTQRSE